MELYYRIAAKQQDPTWRLMDLEISMENKHEPKTKLRKKCTKEQGAALPEYGLVPRKAT